MSQRLTGDPHHRTTDHSDEITKMRELAREIVIKYPDANACPNEHLLEAVVLEGAAALLECHDDTGISLDNWTGPYEVAIQGLLIAGFERDVFLENGV